MTKKQPPITHEGLSAEAEHDDGHAEPAGNVWHLAKTSTEEKLSDFEFLLWRLFYSFSKWQEDCQSCVSNDDVNADEIAVMHLIKMRDRPKSVYEIARLMNRDDMPNLQYTLKKLLKLNIIKKSKKAEKKAIFYEITDKGTKITEKYGDTRRKILSKLLSNLKEHDWEKLSAVITEHKNMYDEASRLAALLRTNSTLIK